MKKQLSAILGITMFATTIAVAATPLNLSSPTASLKSYLQLQRRGGSLAEFKSIMSEENYAIVSAMSEGMGEKIDMAKRMPPEDRYAKCSIAKKDATPERAIFQVKVTYKDVWLKKIAQEMKEMGMDDIPAGQKTGGGIITDAGPGDEDEYPFHINGNGYVSFMFLKQKGTWRFHKSFASNQPTDFTPLLKADDLMGGFTITKREPSKKASAPTSASKQTKIDPKGGITGKFNGKAWTGKYAYLSMFDRGDGDEYKIEVCSEKEPDKYKRMSLQKLDIKLPKKSGVYKLGPLFNMTFYTPPGTNVIGTKGSMTVEKKGDVFNVTLNVRIDDDNELQGGFVFSPSE